jgi:hypothetical protein
MGAFHDPWVHGLPSVIDITAILLDELEFSALLPE